MTSLNQFNLVGTLSYDAEIKVLEDGKKMAFMSVSTSEYYKDAKGNKQSKSHQHRVTCFNPKLIDFIGSKFKKGVRIKASGPVQYRKFKDALIAELVIKAHSYDIGIMDYGTGAVESKSTEASKPASKPTEAKVSVEKPVENKPAVAKPVTETSMPKGDFEDDIPF